MAKIPAQTVDPIAEEIYRWYQREFPQEHRAHLGGSQIGKECDAFLWLQFRWTDKPQFDGRMLRLFQRGWKEEPTLEKNLQGIGIEVRSIDPATGKQFRKSAHGGHFGHGADGLLENVPGGGQQVHLAEYKTANAKSFAKLLSEGLQAGQPHYYDQVQVGMLLHEVERCLFVSVCKDDDRIYTERVKLDRIHAERLLARAGRIIFSNTRPPRISEDPSYYKCARFCDLFDVCHGGKVPEVNCRTCAHATPTGDGDDEGLWHCARYDATIPDYVQRLGCTAHVFLPEFIKGKLGGDMVDYAAESGTAVYADGTKNGPAGEPSTELRDRLNS